MASLITENAALYSQIVWIHKVAIHGALSARAKTLRHESSDEAEMYLRKVKGPRAVLLPSGGVMTRADLPPPDTKRWVASRKALVVRAIGCGLITRNEAVRLYSLTDGEVDGWISAVSRFGEKALLTTRLKEFRT